MIFGTGIGGTFIKNRQVHYGHNFAAGEVSFVITDKDGGLIESDIFGQQCSAIALCKMYAKVKNLPDDFIDGVEVFNSINAGDSTALDCLNNFTKRIAVQISNIQMLLAPQKIAIGGGISVQPVFIDYIRKNINEIYDNADFKFQRPEVVACQFQNDANLIGALQFYISNG